MLVSFHSTSNLQIFEDLLSASEQLFIQLLSDVGGLVNCGVELATINVPFRNVRRISLTPNRTVLISSKHNEAASESIPVKGEKKYFLTRNNS